MQRRWKSLLWYGAALVGACLAIAYVLRLWHADWRVPFVYEGDSIYYTALVKGVAENGWFIHNPFLGAPDGLDLSDFPSADTLHVVLLKMLSWILSEPGAALNVYFVLCFPLSALSAFWVLRRLQVAPETSLAGALLFAFAPYHFLRGEPHLFLSAYYLVPFAALLVLRTLSGAVPFLEPRDDQRRYVWRVRTPRGWLVILTLLAIASAGIYYAFFTGALLVLAGLVRALQDRSRRPFLASVAMTVFLLAGLAANMAPNLARIVKTGVNREATQRSDVEVESYGLKLSQLLVPVTGHRIESLENIKSRYNRTFPYNENDSASLGTLGALGFLLLLAVLFVRRLSEDRLLGGAAIASGLAVLIGTMGGLGALFGFFITAEIRAYNRISIFIAFFAVLGLALLAERARLRWATTRRRALLFVGGLAAVTGAGVLDQTTRYFIPLYDKTRARFEQDRRFVAAIEASLPEGGRILQLPYAPYPEHQPVLRMQAYDHLRPYLHSKKLHWSYGVVKGTPAAAWQAALATKPPVEMVADLREKGFSGLVIDREGFSDRAEDLENGLASLLHRNPTPDDASRLAFFDIRGSALEEKRLATSVQLRFGAGFGPPEQQGKLTWRWCATDCELELVNDERAAQKVGLKMLLSTAQTAPSELKVGAASLTLSNRATPFARELEVPPGVLRLRLHSTARPVHLSGDPRPLLLRVTDVALRSAEAPDPEPLALTEGDGCFVPESAGTRTWLWCGRSGELHVHNTAARAVRVLLGLTVSTGYNDPATVTVEGPLLSASLRANSQGAFLQRVVDVPPGTHVLKVSSDAQQVPAAAGDQRTLVFRVSNFRALRQ